MPPEMDYLDIVGAMTTGDDGCCPELLSAKYPKSRQQRRLSYLAPALIENVALPMKGMRQVWLNAPSTAAPARHTPITTARPRWDRRAPAGAGRLAGASIQRTAAGAGLAGIRVSPSRSVGSRSLTGP